MKILQGGCRVYRSEDEPSQSEGTRTYRKLISRQSGAQYIVQMVSDYSTGRSPWRVNPIAEDVLYCVDGSGTCWIAGHAYAIEPGVGIYIPANAEYCIDSPGPDSIRMVAVCCPEDDHSRVVFRPPSSAKAGVAPERLVREQDRPPIRTGDREFKLLVNKDLGCERITQFIGFIPPSRAPFHFHTYEEAIYILEGSGIVHTPNDSCEFGPGTSIYLPIGCSHCLENPGSKPVRLLGVFYPSGSPAVAYDTK